MRGSHATTRAKRVVLTKNGGQQHRESTDGKLEKCLSIGYKATDWWIRRSDEALSTTFSTATISPIATIGHLRLAGRIGTSTQINGTISKRVSQGGRSAKNETFTPDNGERMTARQHLSAGLLQRELARQKGEKWGRDCARTRFIFFAALTILFRLGFYCLARRDSFSCLFTSKNRNVGELCNS